MINQYLIIKNFFYIFIKKINDLKLMSINTKILHLFLLLDVYIYLFNQKVNIIFVFFRAPNFIYKMQAQLNGILVDIQQFINKNISPKCVLVTGKKGSGKSSLIKFLNGSSFSQDRNQQDIPYLIQKEQTQLQTQPLYYKNQKYHIQLILIKTIDPNDGSQVTIFEMPSFANLINKNQDIDMDNLAGQIVISMYIWNYVLASIPQIHVFLVTPYQFITDDAKFVHFFSIWQQSINKGQEVHENVKKCISIIFTKAEYQDDKQSLMTSLQHLAQTQQSGIEQNNTYSDAVQSERLYCFLAQDTQQGQGKQLLSNILTNAVFYDQANTDVEYDSRFFSSSWEQLYIRGIFKEIEDGEKIGLVYQTVVTLFKKLIQQDRILDKLLEGYLSIIGLASALCLIKILPKQATTLKKQSTSLENELKQALKKQNIPPQTISKLHQNPKKLQPLQLLKILSNIINQLTKSIKQQIPAYTLTNLKQLLQSQYLKLCKNMENAQKNHLIIRYNKYFCIYSILESFDSICNVGKKQIKIIPNLLIDQSITQNLQQYVNPIQNINKQVVKKYGNGIKNKLFSGVRSYEIWKKLSQVKNIAQLPQYKALAPVLISDANQQQEEIIQQQQQTTTNTDPRIKRFYYKTQNNVDPSPIPQLRERAKKIPAKLTNQQDTNQRQIVKNLLNLIQRDSQNRAGNLLLLGKKLQEFRLIMEALQVYMELDNPNQTYRYVSKIYLNELQKNPKPQWIRNFKNNFIPYLQQKCTLYENAQNANIYRQCLHLCYDFLTINYAETAEQFTQIIQLSNQITKPSIQQSLTLPDIQQNNQNDGRQMQSLKYVTFTKADLIEKVYKRDQNKKKNNTLFLQIKKIIQAAKG